MYMSRVYDDAPRWRVGGNVTVLSVVKERQVTDNAARVMAGAKRCCFMSDCGKAGTTSQA